MSNAWLRSISLASRPLRASVKAGAATKQDAIAIADARAEPASRSITSSRAAGAESIPVIVREQGK
jgi:hypothetical protein